MEIEVIQAGIEDKPILQRMMELYQYDFSEFEDTDLDGHGMFGYAYLDHYWVEVNRWPYLVRVDGKLAGFVLVSQHTFIAQDGRSISEFFILRKYRLKGVGSQVARWIFDHHPGKWEVFEYYNNLPSQAFWRKVITEYTAGNFIEVWIDHENQRGPVQLFESQSALQPVRGDLLPGLSSSKLSDR
jgi:predicted acetyltransferase